MKNLKWITRYSDTEKSDKQGRWARLLYFDNMLIVWVSRVGNGETVKYQVNTFFPIHEMTDCPTDHSLHNSFNEAKIWAEKVWDDFVTKVTRIRINTTLKDGYRDFPGIESMCDKCNGDGVVFKKKRNKI